MIEFHPTTIPKLWKLGNVIPVHKKDEKSSVENYRPISLTCLVMKIFERVIKEELLKHTEHYLDKRQHGFPAVEVCPNQVTCNPDHLIFCPDHFPSPFPTTSLPFPLPFPLAI